MCLTIPGKIVAIKNDKALVEYGDEQREAKIMDQSFMVGDYVIIQGRVIVDKISQSEAEKFYSLLD